MWKNYKKGKHSQSVIFFHFEQKNNIKKTLGGTELEDGVK